MDTIEAMRLFADGNTSMHDMRSLLVSMGHSAEDIAQSFTALSSEEGSSIRVGRYQKGEHYAEIYLTARS